MKTSARNQFSGKVKDVIAGVVNAEVLVELSGGDVIVASVTKESLDTLHIKTGISVIALVKAPQIILVSDFAGYKISARNQLPGTISEIKHGTVNSEVDILMKGGQKIVATVTNESASSLGLKKDHAVTAVFKAGAVLLAVPA